MLLHFVFFDKMQCNVIQLNWIFNLAGSGVVGVVPPLRLWSSIEFGPTIGRCTLRTWRLVHCFSLGRAVRRNSSHNNTADRLTKRWAATRWRSTRRTWVLWGQQSAATLWWTTWSRQDFINGALLANRFFLFARRVDCPHWKALMPRRSARLKPHSVACTFHVDIPNPTGNDRIYWPWTNSSVQKKDGRRWFWVVGSLWLGFLGSICTQLPVTRHMCCVRLKCLCVKRNVIVEDSNNLVSQQNPQRILCNALLAPAGAETYGAVRTEHRPVPEHTLVDVFLVLREQSQAKELVCRDVEVTKGKSMSCCMCEPTETSQSLGDDRPALLARPLWVREHWMRTKCGPLRWWLVWPIKKCSNKDVGKRERETHTPTLSVQENAKRQIMRKRNRKSRNKREQREEEDEGKRNKTPQQPIAI